MDNYPDHYHQEPQYISRYDTPAHQSGVSVFCGFLRGIGWVIVASLAGLLSLFIAAAWHSWHVKQAQYDESIFTAFQWILTGFCTFLLALIAGLFYLIWYTKATAKESVLSTDDNYTFPIKLKPGTIEYNDAVKERYNELIDLREYSLCKLAEDVYGKGKKNKYYTDKILAILEEYEDE